MVAVRFPPGDHSNGFKCTPVVVGRIVWLRLMTWVDKDTRNNNMPRDRINSGLMAGVVVAFAAFLFLPGFMIAFPTLVGHCGLGPLQKSQSILGFNVGIELVQLAVVATVAPALILLARAPS